MLFFTFVYGYSQYFHEKHRNDPKKLYIPMDEMSMKDDKDGFKVGSQTNQSSTCDPSASFTFHGDNSNVCINGGNCIEKLNSSGLPTGIYQCNCVKPFTGDNCKINQGVKVDITDNFTSPTEIVRIPMNKREGHNYFIQYNDYL